MKKISTPQLEQVRKMAGEKGIDRDRFQQLGLDNGLLAMALDAIVQGVPISIGVPLVPPVGGRIVTVKVKTELFRDWRAAVSAGGPNTPADYDYNVWKVGGLYPPIGAGIVEEELVLLNYPNGDGSWEKALAWAEQSRLRRTDPRRVFAVGKGHPKFNYEVGPNPCYVVATEECTFGDKLQACSVWWSGSERKANLNWVSYYGHSRDWFAFRK
jgi:hypothetical protein